MTTTAPAPTTVLDALDFHEVPCAHREHIPRHVAHQAAAWVARYVCGCGHRGAYPICDSGKRSLETFGATHSACGTDVPPQDFGFERLETL